MKKILLSGLLLGSVFMGSYAKGQLLLEALDAPDLNPKCVEYVKDRNYGDGDHNFIYCAVLGPNGKKWLKHNLGAEYTKEGSEYFNPEAEPVDFNDWRAFGSLFQDGRKADGHELVDYYAHSIKPNPLIEEYFNKVPNASPYMDFREFWYVTRKKPITNQKQDPLNSNSSFVFTDQDWMTNRNSEEDLWDGRMLNNPCPTGYRIMKDADVRELLVTGPSKVVIEKNNGYTGLSTVSIFHNKDYPNLKIVTAPGVEIIETSFFYHPIQRTHAFLFPDREKNITGTSSLWMLRTYNAETSRKSFSYDYQHPARGTGWSVHNQEYLNRHVYTGMFDRGYWIDQQEHDYGYANGERRFSMAIRCVEE